MPYLSFLGLRFLSPALTSPTGFGGTALGVHRAVACHAGHVLGVPVEVMIRRLCPSWPLPAWYFMRSGVWQSSHDRLPSATGSDRERPKFCDSASYGIRGTWKSIPPM